jgi:hypothetical protein
LMLTILPRTSAIDVEADVGDDEDQQCYCGEHADQNPEPSRHGVSS